MTVPKSSVNVLDLPDELLCVIRNQLSMVDVFYSLVGVNRRLNRVALDPLYIDHVDVTIHGTHARHVQQENDGILERICLDILPRIHVNVTRLTLESLSVQRVLNESDYPNLQYLSFVRFQPETLAHCLTGTSMIRTRFTLVFCPAEKPLRRLLGQQITRLTVDITVDDDEEPTGNDPTKAFVDFLLIGQHLEDFVYFYAHPRGFLRLLSPNSPWSERLSSSLTKLTIKVQTFDDCLHLLNGCLPSLSTLIVRVHDIHRATVMNVNAVQAVELRHFSLTGDRYTFEYEKRVVPLLQRMVHLETLVLYLSIARVTCTYVDGDHLCDHVLQFMPRLCHLRFSLHSKIFGNSHRRLLPLPSTQQLRQSFVRRGLHPVDGCSDETLIHEKANCHVYSLPYLFEQFFFLNNSFRAGQFDRVRILSMYDVRPFEHSFFQIVARDFPFVQQLTLRNEKPQQDRWASRSAVITFHYLSSLDIYYVRDDYVAQFLSADKAHLPRLRHLVVHFEGLTRLTDDFSKDTSCFNCQTITSLVTYEVLAHLQKFYLYFPSL